MKKNFILLMSVMMLCACGGSKTQGGASEEASAEASANGSVESGVSFITIDNDQLEAVDGVDREEFYQAQEFLMEVLDSGSEVDTYSPEWITAHCSADVQQLLRDEYDYEGEGYGKWLMEGRFAGEDVPENEVTGFGYGKRNGKLVYSVEKRYAMAGESFVRTLYFGLERKGDDFVITSFEMNLEGKDPTAKALMEM